MSDMFGVCYVFRLRDTRTLTNDGKHALSSSRYIVSAYIVHLRIFDSLTSGFGGCFIAKSNDSSGIVHNLSSHEVLGQEGFVHAE